jgi:hypothetical protein
VRTVDRARHRELWIWVAVGAVLLGVLLVTAFQYHEFIAYGYGLDDVKGQIKVEQQIERQLRLETRRCSRPGGSSGLPRRISSLVTPAADRAVVVERVTTSPAAVEGHRRVTLTSRNMPCPTGRPAPSPSRSSRR